MSDDDLLPTRVGDVVDVVYCHPLLLQLCNEGTVCILLYCATCTCVCANSELDCVVFLDSGPVIHHVEQGLCVGVVTPLHYCHYTCSRQPGQSNDYTVVYKKI